MSCIREDWSHFHCLTSYWHCNLNVGIWDFLLGHRNRRMDRWCLWQHPRLDPNLKWLTFNVSLYCVELWYSILRIELKSVNSFTWKYLKVDNEDAGECSVNFHKCFMATFGISAWLNWKEITKDAKHYIPPLYPKHPLASQVLAKIEADDTFTFNSMAVCPSQSNTEERLFLLTSFAKFNLHATFVMFILTSIDITDILLP